MREDLRNENAGLNAMTFLKVLIPKVMEKNAQREREIEKEKWVDIQKERWGIYRYRP